MSKIPKSISHTKQKYKEQEIIDAAHNKLSTSSSPHYYNQNQGQISNKDDGGLKPTHKPPDKETSSSKEATHALSSTANNRHLSKNSNSKSDSNGTVEVYEDNFIQEIKNLSELLEEYNYVGMDTEFPGTVYCVPNFTEDFYYRTLKLNCDNLKLIQLGITLTNDKGEYPKDYPIHTWQFNFEFDQTKDKFSQSSMNLLVNSGIDFNILKESGIKHRTFAEYFMASGLVLNPDVHWISFQGSYDFGYLLKNLLQNPLPEKEEDFTSLLSTYFPNHYDIKNYVKGKDNFQGSLNRLAQNLDVLRDGQIHQAGSDSAVTVDVFLKLIKNKVIDKQKLEEKKNTLFGIGNREDNEETINYLLTSGAGGSMKFAQSAVAANYGVNNSTSLSTSNMYYGQKYAQQIRSNMYESQGNMMESNKNLARGSNDINRMNNYINGMGSVALNGMNTPSYFEYNNYYNRSRLMMPNLQNLSHHTQNTISPTAHPSMNMHY